MRHEAIRLVYPNAASINGHSEAWDEEGNVINIDESLVQVEEVKLRAEYDAQEYARARQPLYPAIGDQLDDLYHAGVFSAEMTATLKKVKDDNPK